MAFLRRRSTLASTATLYSKLLTATADVARSELDVAAATEIVNRAFVAGGAAASEQAAVPYCRGIHGPMSHDPSGRSAA